MRPAVSARRDNECRLAATRWNKFEIPAPEVRWLENARVSEVCWQQRVLPPRGDSAGPLGIPRLGPQRMRADLPPLGCRRTVRVQQAIRYPARDPRSEPERRRLPMGCPECGSDPLPEPAQYSEPGRPRRIHAPDNPWSRRRIRLASFVQQAQVFVRG